MVSWIVAPQSNQRGIETYIGTVSACPLFGPQSNQRGIETKTRAGRGDFPPPGPQSNQRGIETVEWSWTDGRIRRASIEPAWD